ncbi:MAG: IgGFc-binding protein [Myxococcales bacterium]|nr:IgGFc-binding protein [Myxococcales bacterium]
MRALRTLRLLCCVTPLFGCGAKTGLESPELDPSADRGGFFSAREGTPRDRAVSNAGTEFYAVSLVNTLLDGQNRFNFAIAIGNPNDQPSRVRVTGGTLRAPLVFTVGPRSSEVRALPWVRELSQHSYRPTRTANNLCLGVGDDRIQLSTESVAPTSIVVRSGAYRIESELAVVAYQFNPLEFRTNEPGCQRHSYTNDASLLYATRALSTRHLVLSHPAAIRTAPGFVAIVGTSDAPTTVTVKASIAIEPGSDVEPISPGETRSFVLGRGDVVELVGRLDERARDISGTEITSDRPVAVFSGVDCTRVGGMDDARPACDHIEEQIPGENTWGRRAVIARFGDRGGTLGSRVRVIASRDNTVVRGTAIPGGVTLSRGQVAVFDDVGEGTIEATEPILAMQFMLGQGVVAETGATVGDPAMTLVPWVEQWRNRYAFYVPSTYTESFAQITAPASATSVSLDGAAIPLDVSAVAGGFRTARVALSPGAHTISSVPADSSDGVGVIVSGVAPFTSYAYAAGVNLASNEP